MGNRGSCLLTEDAAAFVEENAFEVHLQGLGVGGLGQSFLFGNFAVLHKLEQRLVEVQHAVVGAGFDGGGQFVQPVFLEHFFDGAGVDEDFQGGGNSTGDGADHALANHRLEGVGELAADL